MKSKRRTTIDALPKGGQNHCRSLSEVMSRGYFFYCHDTKGVFNYVSPSIRAVLGYSRAEFLKHFTEYLTDSPVNRAVLLHTRLSIKGRRQPPYEVEVRHKDGAPRMLEVLEVPVREGGRVVAVEGLARDITEEKRTGQNLEAARRTAEERERLVLRHSGDGIIGADASGRVIFMNAAAERLLGWKAHDLEGRLLHTAIHRKHADGTPYPLSRCPMTAAIRRGRPSNIEDETLWRKDGTCFPASYSAHPILRGGKPDGAVITLRDITERKKLEESRNFLLHAILHDLNGPMTVISAAADMVGTCPAGLPTCHNREEMGMIREAVEDMKKLLSNILDINRMESGALRLNKGPLCPDALVSAPARAAGILAKSAGKRLELSVPAGLPRVNADPAILRRVLENLLGNALKFAPRDSAVRLSASRKGAAVLFSVSDSGPGVKPENLARIFDKYFQSDQPAEIARKGKGLGLTFCRLAVEAHGGSIRAENLAPSGCRIGFTLPVYGR